MQIPRQVSLQSAGEDQVLTIPHEFTLPGTEVLLRKEGDRLIVEPIQATSLLALLATLEDIPDEFPDIDDQVMPLDNIIF